MNTLWLQIDWPYEIMSKFGFKGKWALYLLDIPTITTHYIDGTMDVRRFEFSFFARRIFQRRNC